MPLRITSHFPDRTELVSRDDLPFHAGSRAQIWMRPFETLLLEIGDTDPKPAAANFRPGR